MSVVVLQLAVDQYIFYAFGELCRLRIRCSIDDGGRIKNRNVGEETFLDQAAIGQVLALRRQGSNLPDGLFERQQVQIARVMSEKTRHAAEGPGMGVRFKQQAIQGHLTGVQANAGPWLLQPGLQVFLAGDEIKRTGQALVGKDEFKKRIE